MTHYRQFETAINAAASGGVGGQHAAIGLLDADRPKAVADATVLTVPDGVAVVVPSSRLHVHLRNVDLGATRMLLRALDGSRTVAQVADDRSLFARSEVARHVMVSLLGSAILLPHVVESLNRRIPHAGIVRFLAQSPHAIGRNYWSNAGDVREQLRTNGLGRRSLGEFRERLSKLHALALVGRDGSSFYAQPGDTHTEPGAWRTVDGAASKVPDAMRRSLRLFAQRFDTSLVTSTHGHRSIRGAVLGHVRDGGSTYAYPDSSPVLLEEVLGELRDLFETVHDAASSRRAAVLALGEFHWLFSHLHPFNRYNNSLAMTIVNWQLERQGLGPMPHLHLDSLAVRMESSGYARLFAAAVEQLACDPDDARWRDHYVETMRQVGWPEAITSAA